MRVLKVYLSIPFPLEAQARLARKWLLAPDVTADAGEQDRVVWAWYMWGREEPVRSAGPWWKWGALGPGTRALPQALCCPA